MSVVGNILEQEDELKGLSNDRLLQEIQTPSGLFAPFLPPSEMQRRNEMRERYEATQEQPSNTIVEQIVAESGGGIGLIEQEGYPPASPMDMLSQPMSSPIPTDLTSQVPVVAAAGAFPDGAMAIEDSGLGGMGGFTEPPMEPQMEQFPQMVAGGGVVGMQNAGQVPDQAPHFYTGNPADYEEKPGWLGRTWDALRPEPLKDSVAFFKWAARKGIDVAQESGESLVNLYKDYQLEVPYETMEQYTMVSPELAYEKYTGRDPEEPSVWAEALEDYREGYTPERFPFFHMDAEARSQLPLGDKLVYGSREALKRNWDLGREFIPAAGQRALDLITSGVGGDPAISPETQREEWSQAVEDVVAGAAEEGEGLVQKYITDPAVDIGGTLQAGWEDLTEGIPSEMMRRPSMSEGLTDEQNRLMLEGMIPDIPESYDPFDPTNERFLNISDLTVDPDAERDRLMMQTMFPEAMAESGIPYEGGEGWLRSALSAGQEGLGFFRDKIMGPVVEKGMEYLSPETFLPDPTKSVDEAELQTEAGKAEAVGAGGTQFMPRGQTPEIPVTNVGGLNIGALTADYKKRAEEISVSAEEDEATAMSEIASLISKTQDDARKDAFDTWMMNVGAGVASGDMAGGLEKGAVAIGDIKKEARDAVRSLDATRLSRYFEGSKEEMARLVSMASIDANFANALVTLMVEQGRAGRADKILIGSVFAAMLDDTMGTYQDVPVTDILRTATRAVTGGNSDIPIPTYNTIEGALE